MLGVGSKVCLERGINCVGCSEYGVKVCVRACVRACVRVCVCVCRGSEVCASSVCVSARGIKIFLEGGLRAQYLCAAGLVREGSCDCCDCQVLSRRLIVEVNAKEGAPKKHLRKERSARVH